MKTLYCKQGGMMEDPDWHWEVIGQAEGETLKEVADNYAKTDAEFKKFYEPQSITMYGWKLSIDPACQNLIGVILK